MPFPIKKTLGIIIASAIFAIPAAFVMAFLIWFFRGIFWSFESSQYLSLVKGSYIVLFLLRTLVGLSTFYWLLVKCRKAAKEWKVELKKVQEAVFELKMLKSIKKKGIDDFFSQSAEEFETAYCLNAVSTLLASALCKSLID